MLWQAGTEVMLDMWRIRFGYERVDYWQLYDEKACGDPNDWPYVARLLKANGKLTWHNPMHSPGTFYQLKEDPPGPQNKECKCNCI